MVILWDVDSDLSLSLSVDGRSLGQSGIRCDTETRQVKSVVFALQLFVSLIENVLCLSFR